MPRLSTATDSGKLFPCRSAWWTAVCPSRCCHWRDNGHLTCRMCALITGLLLKTERVGDAGGGAKAADWLRRKQHYVTRHPQSAPPPLTPTALILQRATGQVSRHWLHVLHLGCLAFFSSPKWSSEFHVAGRVTGWEMGASKWGRLDEAQAPVKRTMGFLGPRRRHTGLASCHLLFGMINPQRTGTHLWVLLFLMASPVVVLEKIWGF